LNKTAGAAQAWIDGVLANCSNVFYEYPVIASDTPRALIAQKIL
jgi:hypothetical protein